MRQTLSLALLALTSTVWGANCPSRQDKNGDALLQIEQNWAQALQQKNVDAVACIIGDDFEDAGVDGQVHNRNEALAHVPQRRPGSNTLSEMHAHVHGDMGYVRGLNTIKDQDGKAVAQVRFTDIFVYQDGVWKAVAGQETLLEKSKQ